MIQAIAAATLFAAACGKSSEPPAATERAAAGGSAQEAPAPSGLIGVDPSVFQCESIAPVGAISAAAGVPVEAAAAQFDPPSGTPRPCNYQTVGAATAPPPVGARDAAAPAQAMWSISFDCRDHGVAAATRLIEQYAAEGGTPMEVGAASVDHRDAAILFIDDDAPCSVTVLGPGQAQRLAIARAVAERLHAANAPMRPRAAPAAK
jgi:hypothetical protein